MIRLLLAALAAALVLAGVQTWRIDRLKFESAVLKTEAHAAEVWRVQARDDAQTAADRCLDRVAASRLSAQRIETIIERPVHVDPQGCPVRELVPADQLRDALQPRASAE
ncbi:MAG: hypothetical protein V4707_11860 [Pseudomonadota bacterium]